MVHGTTHICLVVDFKFGQYYSHMQEAGALPPPPPPPMLELYIKGILTVKMDFLIHIFSKLSWAQAQI